MQQKDLFDPTQSGLQVKSETAPKSWLQRYRFEIGFDHVLMIAIGLIFSVGVSYVGGFEMGKKSTLGKKKPVEPVVAVSVASAPAESTSSGVASVPQTDETVMLPTVKEPAIPEQPSKVSGNYTIQIVSYTKTDAAKQFVDKLLKSGYQSFSFPTGKYINVCMNGFDSKKKAEIALTELKQKGIVPQDAYVRNMPNLSA